jgi:DNA primase
MARISKAVIQEVNNRMDAIAVVGDYVRLEQKSGRWWGRCPFHAGGQEKTPSFTVNPDSKMYYCFGCTKGGSVLDFVMEMDKLTFPEAIKHLAKKTGIEIVYEDGSPDENTGYTGKDELYELYRRTTTTFQYFLREKQAGQDVLNYIKKRGFSEEMIERFKLGYSPAQRDFLHKFLESKGYSPDFLERSGLFSSRYKTSPMFSARLMFPIADRQGRIVAFGGRALPGAVQSDGNEPPKYINSPETEIYKKGQTLYAIDLALAQIRQSKIAYLGEGYMDVIAMHQAGITNAVAPLGTAFTDEQANLLKRWAEKIVLVFDTDEAGEKAAYKAIVTCRKNGLSCAVIQGTGTQENIKFKDPADILQNSGQEILKKYLLYYINDFEYLLSRSKLLYETAGGKNRAVEFLFPYLEALDSEIERDDCIVQIAGAFLLDHGAVQKDYSSWKTGGHSPQRRRQEGQEQPAVVHDHPLRMNAELFLLTVVSVNMTLYPEFRAALEIKEIDDPAAKELFVAMEECYIHDETGIDSLLPRIKSDPLKKFVISRGASAEFRGGPGRDPRRLMEDGINEIRKKRLRKRLVEIGAELRNNERTAAFGSSDSDSGYIDELLSEKKSIDSQIRKLEGR